MLTVTISLPAYFSQTITNLFDKNSFSLFGRYLYMINEIRCLQWIEKLYKGTASRRGTSSHTAVKSEGSLLSLG